MKMEPPPGYPPPTLVRKKSRGMPVKAVLLFLVLLGVGYFAVTTLLSSDPPPPAAPPAVERAPVGAGGAVDANSAAAAIPDAAAPPVIVEQPIEEGAATGNAGDARKANQWYFVSRLGDGPGAIYSRDGGRWNFAFACTTRTRTIEFIAVGVGSPGDFAGQVIHVGTTKLDLDATYSKDGGGTIIAALPASHDFFSALDGSTPMEVQLVADRKTIVPIGPDVVRLISTCRGRT